MKNLSKIVIASLLGVFLALGCKKELQKTDPCAGVICLNGGYCADGSCNCPPGYSGKDCGIMKVDKFAGTYMVHDTGYFSWTMQSGTDPCFQSFIIDRNHVSAITVNKTNPFEFTISNFFGDSTDVICYLKSSDDYNFFASYIPIKYGACSDGYIKFQDATRPHGTITFDGKKITVTADIDYTNVAPNQSWHYVNNFVSTFIRQ